MNIHGVCVGVSSSSGTQRVIGTGGHNVQRSFVHGDSTISPSPHRPLQGVVLVYFS